MALAVIKLSLLGFVGWQIVLPQQDGTTAVVRVNAVAPALAQETAPPKEEPRAALGQDAMRSVNAPQKNDQNQVLDLQNLMRRQEELDRREKELKALEDKIARDLASLAERRAQLTRMLDEANTLKDKKDRHLIDVFSNMKAKQAASVLETMDEIQAVKILAGMRGRQAGEILTFVNSEKAARLAEQLTSLQIPFQ